jgi:hypothetical protein
MVHETVLQPLLLLHQCLILPLLEMLKGITVASIIITDIK